MKSKNEATKEIQLKELALASLREGFKLEHETFLELQNALSETIKVEHNKQIKTTDIKMFSEIDVYGHYVNDQSSYHYLIECKGASTQDKLLLVEVERSQYDNPKQYHQLQLTNNGEESKSCIVGGGEGFKANMQYGPRLVYSGDFFSRSSKGIKKSDAGKNKTRFYKAIEQLRDCAIIFQENKELHCTINGIRNFIFPIIVTNVDVCIVNYGENEIKTAPWAFCKLADDENYNEDNLGYMPYVFVTNIRNLTALVERLPQSNLMNPDSWGDSEERYTFKE